MKALTLTQPWATLVAEGRKRIETRGWSTTYRGPLLIHAARGYPGWAEDLAVSLHGLPGIAPRILETHPGDLPRGAIVAIVDLVDVIPTSSLVALDEIEAMLGDYTPGRFAWMLENVRAVDPPVPARGALSLWEGPDL